MYDKMAIVRIFGHKAPAPDGAAGQRDKWVAWFSDAEDMRTLHNEGIEYTFAYKLGRGRQLKTVTNKRVGFEDLKPGEKALCVNTTFSLRIAYRSCVDLVKYKNDPSFMPALHRGGGDEIISARIRLTLNLIRGDGIDLTVARVLSRSMKGARHISRFDLEGEIGNELVGNVHQQIQTFLTVRKYGGADLEARADTELRDYLNEKYFTDNVDGEDLPKCLKLQRVAVQLWPS